MIIKDKLSHIIIIEDEKGQAFDEHFLSKPDKSDKYKKGNWYDYKIAKYSNRWLFKCQSHWFFCEYI